MADALADPKLLSEAKKRNVDILPASWQEVDGYVKDVLNTPPAVIARVKKALGLD